MNIFIVLKKLFKSLNDTKNIKTFYLVYSLVLRFHGVDWSRLDTCNSLYHF